MIGSRVTKATRRRGAVSDDGDKGFRDESPPRSESLGETALSLNTMNISLGKISVETPIAADQPVKKRVRVLDSRDSRIQGLDRPAVSRDLEKVLDAAADPLQTPIIQSSELPSSVPLLLKLVAQVSEAEGLSLREVCHSFPCISFIRMALFCCL